MTRTPEDDDGLSGPGLNPPQWDELRRLKRAIGEPRASELQQQAWDHHLATVTPALTAPLYPRIWLAVLEALRNAVIH